jgi:hypothetical protein
VIVIDRSLLLDAGLSRLPENLSTVTLRATYAALETRVGLRLAAGMSDDQLDEFEAYFSDNDDEGAFAWLIENFPDYKSQVQEEWRTIRPRLVAAGRWIAAVTSPS